MAFFSRTGKEKGLGMRSSDEAGLTCIAPVVYFIGGRTRYHCSYYMLIEEEVRDVKQDCFLDFPDRHGVLGNFVSRPYVGHSSPGRDPFPCGQTFRPSLSREADI